MKNSKSFKSLMAKETARGILSILLYFVLLVVGQIIAAGILLLFRKVTGVFNEEVFDTAISWISFAILLIVFVIIYYTTLKEDVKRLTKKDFYFIAAMLLITLVLNYGSTTLLEVLGVQEASNENPIKALGQVSVFVTLIMTTICGPVIEELVFRKAVNQIIRNKFAFIAVSALFFGLVHETSIRMIPYVLIGAMCAFTYIKTDKNIISAITIHVINNLVFTLWIFFV